MKKGFLGFIQEQRQTVPPVTTADLSGKTVLITGANTGIGYETAKHFAQMNPGKLILGCRSQDKGVAAIAKLKEETGFGRIELKLVDLSSFGSVIKFCDAVNAEEDRLDIFVANAAIFTDQYRLTDDGWESSLQVNVLSTLLGAVLLAPLMVKTGQTKGSHPRIVIVGSGIHYLTTFKRGLLETDSPLRTLNSREYSTKSAMDQRYGHSKIIALFMTRTFAKILKNTPVIVDCVDPGFCLSDIRREMKGMQKWISFALEKYLAWTAEEGSRQYVWAALANEDNINVMRGAYISSTSVQEPSDYIISEEGARDEKKFWGNLVEELSKVDPRVPGVIQSLERTVS